MNSLKVSIQGQTVGKLSKEIIDAKLLSPEEQTFIEDLKTFILDRAKKFREISVEIPNVNFIVN